MGRQCSHQPYTCRRMLPEPGDRGTHAHTWRVEQGDPRMPPALHLGGPEFTASDIPGSRFLPRSSCPCACMHMTLTRLQSSLVSMATCGQAGKSRACTLPLPVPAPDVLLDGRTLVAALLGRLALASVQGWSVLAQGPAVLCLCLQGCTRRFACVRARGDACEGMRV